MPMLIVAINVTATTRRQFFAQRRRAMANIVAMTTRIIVPSFDFPRLISLLPMLLPAVPKVLRVLAAGSAQVRDKPQTVMWRCDEQESGFGTCVLAGTSC